MTGLWQQRARELQNARSCWRATFGFRAAVATGDTATMQSALGNAAARLRVENAFIVALDGASTASTTAVANQARRLWESARCGPADRRCGARRQARGSWSRRRSWRRR
jgi:hypothetical protein